MTDQTASWMRAAAENPVRFVLTPGLLWLCLEYVALGPASFVQYLDVADAGLAALVSLSHETLSWDTWKWHPYSITGTSRLVTSYFIPGHVVLFSVFSGWVAYQIVAVSQIILAGIGAYLLCSRKLSISPLLSTFAGLACALVFQGGALHSGAFAYLLVTIFMISRVLDWKLLSLKTIAILALGLIYSSFSQIQFLLPFSFVLIALWFLFVEKRYRASEWCLLFIFVLAACLIRLPEITALVDFASQSNRTHPGSVHFEKGALHFQEVFSFYIQTMHGSWNNEVIHILAVYAVFMIGLTVKGVWGWQGASKAFRGLALVLVLLWLFPRVGELSKSTLAQIAPFLIAFHFSKFNILVYLLLPIAAMGGLETLSEKSSRRITFGNRELPIGGKGFWTAVAFSLLIVMSIDLKIQHARSWLQDGSFIFHGMSPVLESLAKERENSLEPFRVATLQKGGPFAQAYGLEAMDGHFPMFSRRYGNFWARVIEPYAQEHRDGYRFDADGSLLPLFRPDLNYFGHTPEVPFDKLYRGKLLSLANVKYVLSRDKLVSTNLSLVEGPTQPWNSLSTFEKARSNALANFKGKSHLYVYENKSYFPRFFIATKVKSFKDDMALTRTMSQASLQGLRSTAYVRSGSFGENASPFLDGASGGKVRIKSYQRNQIELAVAMASPGVLLGSISFDPFWRCFVDGNERQIFPADGAFWGVFLEKTAQKVVFRYEPPLLRLPK